MLGDGLRARSVRGESGDFDSSPEPSAGLIGEGQPLRGCEGFGVITPGIASRHPGILPGRPYGTACRERGGYAASLQDVAGGERGVLGEGRPGGRPTRACWEMAGGRAPGAGRVVILTEVRSLRLA